MLSCSGGTMDKSVRTPDQEYNSGNNGNKVFDHNGIVYRCCLVIGWEKIVLTEKNPLLALGTVGWNRGFAEANFYPDDLPEDWRLTYLSNELDCVAIVVDEWADLDEDEIEEWLDETHEQFHFYLMAPDDVVGETLLQPLLDQFEPLQPQLKGVLLEQWGESPVLKGQRLCRLAPLSLELGMEAEVDALVGGDGVAVLTASAELSPLVVRKIVERLRAEAIGTLLLVPSKGLLGNLESLETISALLGELSK